LIASTEVPTDVTTSHDKARHGCHRADNNCLARRNDSETQIKPFYEFERRNELDGGAVVDECCNAMKKKLSANHGDGDDANVISEQWGKGCSGLGTHYD
jgi:hypothetical protein